MSHIRAKLVDQGEAILYDHGFALPDINTRGRADLDANLENELLGFVLGVIEELDDLDEGQALVIWKEIF